MNLLQILIAIDVGGEAGTPGGEGDITDENGLSILDDNGLPIEA